LEEVRNGERVNRQEKKKGKPAITDRASLESTDKKEENDGRKEREDG
jgi:hypothetical protein